MLTFLNTISFIHTYVSYDMYRVCFKIHYFTDKETESQKLKWTKFTRLETDGCESRVLAF